ncbi:MAG: 5-formyltetrahydrofolate cyclo-ligase [Rhizobiales bacterium]|nr:5-formyltetrahydrofolate cyclo-ligase [Hyphomicrobiales bacterium]
MMNLASEKKQFRAEAQANRVAAFEADQGRAGEILAVRGLPPTVSGRSISGFAPYQSEISVMPLLTALAKAGWITALPVVIAKNQPLVFRAWLPGSETVPGIWNIPVPPPTSSEVAPDVLLVPLLAFDREGYRLGYGGGFYDRTLAKLRAIKSVTAIGIAYAAQEVPSVPHDAHDQRLDWIMTERETIAPTRS